ncbi:MAG TPA: thiol-disulfide isomerase, partial [Nitrososphaeraceae archaeon]
INCIHTIPHLNEWYAKYANKGFVIAGIQTPEFEFEKNLDSVKDAVKGFGIKYPVIQDNNYGTWNTYGNRYWPRDYLVDNEGYIRYDHVGEGGYNETENMIQSLLAEPGTNANYNRTVTRVLQYSTLHRHALDVASVGLVFPPLVVGRILYIVPPNVRTYR